MVHFLYYNGSQSVILGPEAAASASAGISVRNANYQALPKTA